MWQIKRLCTINFAQHNRRRQTCCKPGLPRPPLTARLAVPSRLPGMLAERGNTVDAWDRISTAAAPCLVSRDCGWKAPGLFGEGSPELRPESRLVVYLPGMSSMSGVRLEASLALGLRLPCGVPWYGGLGSTLDPTVALASRDSLPELLNATSSSLVHPGEAEC